ncbi:MAG TPA: hypothetical protein QGI69_00940 [Candidatus Marinimicrobia bacterium]|jgi:DNA-binding NtrC family response regulator|nr:hypothetical protein [Candidatus Neomarinimicrobiota bacterium]|tara:strand:- start:1112 stop:1465 length:354 start_codon:yes stop_codon:yes gene_type:complete
MKIFFISNDSFLGQELITELAPNKHFVEVYNNGFTALKDIRETNPEVIIIDSNSEGINPRVLLKLIARDSRLEDSKIFYLKNNPVDDPEKFSKKNEITKLWFKPVKVSDIINQLSVS